MNDQNETAQLRFLEETATRLRQNGFTVEPIEDHHLPVCWEKGRLCRVSGKGSVLYRQENVDSIRAQDALQTVIDTAKMTSEYMAILETAPRLKASGLDGDYSSRTQTETVRVRGESCAVDKVIELPSPRFKQFSHALLADYDFIAENKNAIRHDEDARHCLLILDADGKDGFLVDPQGHNYARYSAFVPNARSLLTPDMGIDRSYLSPAEPWRDESRDEMLRMTLRVDGKPDYTLVLPADEEYLDAVKAYLDIDVFADALLCDIRFKVPYIGELIRDMDCPAVEDYNDFAEALEDIWQQDGMLLTYAAVLDAEKPETLHRACELLRNLDNYQRITEDAYGYGQQRLQETLGLDDEAIYELDGYMDFEKYGQDCMENDGVTKTEFGLLRRLDPPFPEQTQGQRMM